MKEVTEFSIRLYRWLARCLPNEFRLSQGDEMVHLSEDLIRQEASRRGLAGFLPFMLRLVSDLLWRSAVEHTEALHHDLTYSMRTLGRSPWLALACIVSLGIGIGSTSAVYQQIRGFYFSSVPGVGAPEQLVRVQGGVSYPEFTEFRDHAKMAGLTAYMAPVPFLVTTGGRTERVWGHLVTPDYFEVLQARMSLGSGFTPASQHTDAAPEVVVSRRFWETHLRSDPNAVGQNLRINGHEAMLAGVAASDFLGASPMYETADVWIPVSSQPRIAPELAGRPLENTHVAAFEVIGRLPRGMSLQQAESSLDIVARRFEEAEHDRARQRQGRRVTLIPGGRVMPLSDRDRIAASSLPAVLIGLLLWIACSNVANLLLARAAGRRREVAVRLAIGGSRWRVMRQLLTESVLLSLLGGAAGLLFAYWSNSSMKSFQPVMPEYIRLHLESDWTILPFTLAIAVITGILFGLAPARHATRDAIAPALRGGALSRFPAFKRFSSRNLIVIQQLAGSLMLLLLTGFILIGVHGSTTPDLGFNPHDLYRMSLDPVREGYSATAAESFLGKVLDRVRSQAGVESASLSLSAPMEPFSTSTNDATGGGGLSGVASILKRVETSRVGAGFFETSGVSLLAGRTFTKNDEGQSRVTVVNEKLAHDLFPGKSAVGQVLETGGSRFEIVGVVKDIRSNYIFNIPQRRAYLPLRSEDLAAPGPRGIALLVRSAPGTGVDTLVRRTVAQIDPRLTIFDFSSMDQRVADLMGFVRMVLYVYGGIGFFSLILAAVGLSGVTAYAVAQREREIGIRMALGARASEVIRLVMREGSWLVIIGTAIGAVCSFGLLRMLSRILDTLAQVTAASTSDPILLIGAPVLLAVLTMLACYLPARRSVRIDPISALRQE